MYIYGLKIPLGNISAAPGYDIIYFGEFEFEIFGDTEIVQYVDTTGKDYYEYSEELQGGYNIIEGIPVEVLGSVNHEATGTYTLTYKAFSSGIDLDQKTRTVHIISNIWGTTEYATSDGKFRYVLNTTDSRYAKIIRYTGTVGSTLTIPSTVTTGSNTYRVVDVGSLNANSILGTLENSNITNIILPTTLINIGDNAFKGLRALNTIQLPIVYDNSTSIMSISANAFNGAATISGVSNLRLNKNLREIKNSAFENCNIGNIIFEENGVRKLGDRAFYLAGGTLNTTINFPASLKEIGNDCFYGYKIRSMTVEDENENFKIIGGISLSDKLGERLILYPISSEFGSYIIPEGIKYIGRSALACAINLESVACGLSIETIETGAFGSMEKIKYITMRSAPAISASAFAANPTLEKVIIGNKTTVASLSNSNAFSNNAIIYVPNAMVAGYKANSVYRQITNYNTRIRPTLELSGDSRITWLLETPYVEYGAKIVDEFYTQSSNVISVVGMRMDITGNTAFNQSIRYPIEYTATINGIEFDKVIRNIDVSDFEPPVIQSVITDTDWVYREQKFTVSATDNIEVTQYLIKQDNATPLGSDARWISSNILTVPSNGTWYIFAKDSTGNISISYRVEATWVCVEKWDVSKQNDGSIYAVVQTDTPKPILRIKGTGETKDFATATAMPWYSTYRNTIRNVIIENGVSYLGNYMLANLPNAEEIDIASSVNAITVRTLAHTNNYNTIRLNGNTKLTYENFALYTSSKDTIYAHSMKDTSNIYQLPATVKTIGEYAFENNMYISTLNLSNVTTINEGAFRNALHIANLYVPKTLQEISSVGRVFESMEGPVYFYSSCDPMMAYVEMYGYENNFIEIDDIKPIITSVKLDDGATVALSRTVDVNLTIVENKQVAKILMEEERSESVSSGDSRWTAYPVSGVGSYTFSGINGERILYVWAMDTSNNISAVPISDTIVLADYNFIMHHNEDTVQYIDQTSKDYYEYNEVVQGGYTLEDSVITVTTSGAVNHEIVGNYNIKYELSIGPTVVGEFLRNVDIINNSWGVTEYTQGKYKFVTHTSKPYAKIVAYTGSEVSVTIPENVSDGTNSYKIIDIGGKNEGNIFNRNNVTSITLPNSIMNISENAFMNCSGLRNITIPDSVMRIENSAFKNCNLTSLSIGDNVRVIEESAFEENQNALGLSFGMLTKEIGEFAFKYAGSVITLNILNSIDVISEGAFAGMNIGSIRVEEGTTKYLLDEGCLIRNDGVLLQYETDSNRNTIKISDIVGVIGNGAFENVALLQNILVEDNTIIKSNAFANSNTITKIALLHASGETCTLENINAIPVNANIYVVDINEYLAADNWNLLAVGKIKPILELNGNENITIEAGDSYTELGVYVLGKLLIADGEIFTGDSRATLEIDSNFDTTVLGNQRVIYKMKYNGEVVTTITRYILVEDTTPPVILDIDITDLPQAGREKFVITATDNHRVTGYIMTQGETPDVNDAGWNTENETYATSNGIWTVWVKDEAGNMSSMTAEANNVCIARWDIGINNNMAYAVIGLDMKLYIIGSGEIRNYEDDNRPWIDYLDQIVGIEVEENILNLTENTLADMPNARNIKLPSTLTNTGLSTFRRTNNFETVEISPLSTLFVYENDTIYSKDYEILYAHSDANASEVYDYTINSNTKTIAEYAFTGNNYIQNITTTSNPDIGVGAFSEMSSIENIIGEIGGEGISALSFANSTKLARIDLSPDITYIGEYAFSNCNMLTILNLEYCNELTTLYHHSFANLLNMESIIIPKSVTTILADTVNEKLVFDRMGENLSQNAIVYYYESCDAMYNYATTTPDNYVDFVMIDDVGPRLRSLMVTNKNAGEYIRDTQLIIKAKFSENIIESQGVLPELEIAFGNGISTKLPSGELSGDTITYTYTINENDFGLLRCVSFVGTVYDVSEKVSEYTSAQFSGNEIIARTGVLVTQGVETSYYTRLKYAIAGVTNNATVQMLLDEDMNDTVIIPENKTIILSMNNKKLYYSIENDIATNVIINRGNLVIQDGGTISVSGENGVIYAIVNENEISIYDIEVQARGYGTENIYGVYNKTGAIMNMHNIKINAVSTEGYAYGIYNESEVVISSGDINVATDTGRAYGIYSNDRINHMAGIITATVYNEISGRSWGIYSEGSNVTIGASGDSINLQDPYIFSSYTGIVVTTGELNFYDGTVEAKRYNSVLADIINTPNTYSLIKTELAGGKEKAALGFDSTGPIIRLTNMNRNWTKNAVPIQIQVIDEESGVKGVTFDGEDITLTNGSVIREVSVNGIYIVEAEDKAGNISTERITISNIDRDAPIINAINYGNAISTELQIEVLAQDALSGLYGYRLSRTDITPTTWVSVDTSNELIRINAVVNTNGTYYLYLVDVAGNVVRYAEEIVIENIDSENPKINTLTIRENSYKYSNSSMILLDISAEDDTEIKEVLLSNTLLTTSAAINSNDWVPYEETVLWQLEKGDGRKTVYVWVRDVAERVSAYASATTQLLSEYLGGTNSDETSFRILAKDENYNSSKAITTNDIMIRVKGNDGSVNYETLYGENIEINNVVETYGPVQEGANVMNGRFYTITATNMRGRGTIFLVFKNNAVTDITGNVLSKIEIPTDVVSDTTAPVITRSADTIVVSDAEGYAVQAIRINGQTVLLDGGTVSISSLRNNYNITLKAGDKIEAFDKCGNKAEYIEN